MRRQQQGDTIVEVMVAFAVFALVAAGAITVMNRGLATAQRSLEITLVREQIDSQAELLRYARDTSSSVWQTIKSSAASDGGARCYADDNLPSAAFYMNITNPGPASGSVEYRSLGNLPFPQTATYSRVAVGNTPSAEGLWIVPVRVGTSNAYDMHIHACWDSVGSEVPVTLGTIVRLYDT